MEKCNALAEKDALAAVALLDTPTMRTHAQTLTDNMVCAAPPQQRYSAARFDGQHEMPWNEHANMVAETDDALSHVQQSIDKLQGITSVASRGMEDEQNMHLLAASSYVMQHSDNLDNVIQQRDQKMQRLREISRDLQPNTQRVRGLISPLNFPVAKRINSALFFVMALSTGYPDTTIATDLVVGMQNCGHFPASGSHAPCHVPASLEELDPTYKSRNYV